VKVIKRVQLTDGSEIEVGLTGNAAGRTVMLPVAKKTVTGQEAERLAMWGIDPEFGQHFVEGLNDSFRVLYFDYEGHLFSHPNPEALTAELIVKDLLFIADSMKIDRFSYYGYSWLALVGLQLALRTDRLDSIIMGGFPPYEGPYLEMMTVTRKTYEQALSSERQHAGSQLDEPANESWNPDHIDWDNVPVTIDPKVSKQFMTLYQSLADFDDRTVQHKLTIPRLAFAGEQDTIVYGSRFGNVTVDIAGLLAKNKEYLEKLGWEIERIEGSGMDHTKAMQPAVVLPLIKPWLIEKANKFSNP